MKAITKKSIVKNELGICFKNDDVSAFVSEFKNRLLDCKVKFPLLEYCANEICGTFPDEKHLAICDRIEAFKTEGGNVVLGIILRQRLSTHFNESIDKAVEYISRADEWFVPDIIGERVFGWALLHHPEKTLHVFKRLIKHENKWVVRSLGAGAHNAIKNELEKSVVRELFLLLLSQSGATDHQIKRGIGWAAKTTARFHPDLISEHRSEIDGDETGRWFQSKVEMGLKRDSRGKGN